MTSAANSNEGKCRFMVINIDGAEAADAPAGSRHEMSESERSANSRVAAENWGAASTIAAARPVSKAEADHSREALRLVREREPHAQRMPVVLAIGAHPDDLELACGGTLAKLAQVGYEVHAMVMSHGQVGGNAELRPSEARAGGELLGLAQVQVLDFPDTELGLHNVGMVKAIEARMDELEPTVVLTHAEHDHHQDHHAVHFATLRAARRHPSILCFESPSTTRGFDPSLYVDIADFLDVKIRAVELHGDQSEKLYMGADRIRGIATFRGAQAKRTFAEGFEVVRMLDTIPGGKL